MGKTFRKRYGGNEQELREFARLLCIEKGVEYRGVSIFQMVRELSGIPDIAAGDAWQWIADKRRAARPVESFHMTHDPLTGWPL